MSRSPSCVMQSTKTPWTRHWGGGGKLFTPRADFREADSLHRSLTRTGLVWEKPLESPEVEELLHIAINPDAAIRGDDTALMVALWRHNFDVVQLLLEAGAQVDSCGRDARNDADDVMNRPPTNAQYRS